MSGRDALGDAHDESMPHRRPQGLASAPPAGPRRSRWFRACLGHRLSATVSKNGKALVHGAALAWSHTAHDGRSVFAHRFRGKSRHAPVRPWTSERVFCQRGSPWSAHPLLTKAPPCAHRRHVAGRGDGQPESASILVPCSTLVPASRTTSGTRSPTSATAPTRGRDDVAPS